MVLKNKYLLLILFILFSDFVSAQSWTIFRGNQQLTGATSASIPDKPKLLLNVVLTFLVSLFTGIAAVLLFTSDKSREW